MGVVAAVTDVVGQAQDLASDINALNERVFTIEKQLA